MDAIFQFFYNALNVVVNMIPNFVTNVFKGNVEGQSALWDTIGGVSCIVPVSTVIVIIGLVFGIYSLEVIWAVAMWVVRKIPSIN